MCETKGHTVAIGLDFEEGMCRKETVASDFFATHDTLSQTGTPTGVEFVEGGNGGQRVAHQATVDRHEIDALFSVVAEPLEFGEMVHNGRIPMAFGGKDPAYQRRPLSTRNFAPPRAAGLKQSWMAVTSVLVRFRKARKQGLSTSAQATYPIDPAHLDTLGGSDRILEAVPIFPLLFC